MPIAFPFYFAWCEPTETTFDPVAHARMDEYIFSAIRTLAEGEKPLLEIEIQNPHVGILSPERKYWAWFSWHDGATLQPLFFGRVVGVPVEIFDEVIRVQFIADPIDYKQRVQHLAEGMKVRPYYDPVFIDAAHRDDPDTILEAHAKVWDVNPVTHAVSANDLLVGLDGNVNFTGDDHFYDGMSMTVGQPPATAILMDASVNWKQTARGTIDMGNKIYQSYSGDGLISEWPKPLASLGSGWSVFNSNAVDLYHVAHATTVSGSYNWTNKEKKHKTGDSMSVSQSWSTPSVTGIKQTLTLKSQSGFLDPKAKDNEGDPAPVNIPMSVNETYAVVPGWTVSTSLILQYVAERQRTERVIFSVRADTQPVLVDPTLSQESETLTRSGVDVGAPILRLLNWTTVSGTFVDVGQVIFPDNPKVPGGRSAQVCVTAGTCGTVVPNFSDIVGFTTNDGTAVWASIGSATPPDNASDWTAVSNVPLGQVILPKRPFYTTYEILIQPGKVQNPPTGVSVSVGTIVLRGAMFQVCTTSGLTGNTTGPAAGETAVFTNLGPKLPSGSHYYIATQGGQTGPEHLIPPFNEELHATTSDGSVIWTCIGQGDIPVGGITGDTWAPSYFTQDRGRSSLEYLASIVRARLIYRARCVEIKFDSTYGRGAPLTTRQTCTLHDPRIAGGIALGKVKNAVLQVSDSGIAGCAVTLACCAGLGNAVEEVEGDPAYVATGYVGRGYQQYDQSTVLVGGNTDLAYAPPVYASNDDGLSFPLTRQMVVITDTLHTSAQAGAVRSALDSMARAAQLQAAPGDSVTEQNKIKAQQANSVAHQLALHPVWQEYELKPVNGGPFNKVYNVQFTRLTLPRGVDLQSGAIT